MVPSRDKGNLAMTILKNFDIEALRKSRLKASQKSKRGDLLAGINQISPEIAKLKVGETAQIECNAGKAGLRKFVMQIVAKTNHITAKGGEWEGRAYKVVSDGESTVYVQRGEDSAEARTIARGADTKERKPRASKGADKALAKGRTHLEGGALVTEHGEEAEAA
jgi:hypothetical protein